MNRFLPLAFCLALAGCGTMRQQLGLEKNTPDEFSVVTRAPLSIPPSYDLPVPTPGAARPQEQTTSDMAAAALLGVGSTVSNTAGSASGGYLLQQVATPADDTIRQVVDQEAAASAAERKGVSGILLKRAGEERGEQVVDAGAEVQRVRAAKAAATPVTGDAAAVKTDKKPNFWQRNFGF